MRLVLDTNVLVSGLLSPFGPPGDILRLITTGTVRVCYDARILGEYSQVLRRPAFSFSPAQVDAVLAQLEADGDLVLASRHPAVRRLRAWGKRRRGHRAAALSPTCAQVCSCSRYQPPHRGSDR